MQLPFLKDYRIEFAHVCILCPLEIVVQISIHVDTFVLQEVGEAKNTGLHRQGDINKHGAEYFPPMGPSASRKC